MHRWARIAVGVLLLWLLAVVVWAARPWSDTQLLRTPPKVADKEGLKSVTYECGAVLGSASSKVQGDTPPKYPLTRTPCQDRSQRHALALADLGLAAGALVVVAAVGRRRDGGVTVDAGPLPAPQ